MNERYSDTPPASWPNDAVERLTSGVRCECRCECLDRATCGVRLRVRRRRWLIFRYEVATGVELVCHDCVDHVIARHQE